MRIDISIGELVDKVTILSIKLEKVNDEQKLKNIKLEYSLLIDSVKSVNLSENSEDFIRLKKVNQKLWEIEDKIRFKEKKKEFDEEFIELARSVYFENDKRAEIKKEINLKTNSEIVEEKEYVDY